MRFFPGFLQQFLPDSFIDTSKVSSLIFPRFLLAILSEIHTRILPGMPLGISSGFSFLDIGISYRFLTGFFKDLSQDFFGSLSWVSVKGSSLNSFRYSYRDVHTDVFRDTFMDFSRFFNTFGDFLRDSVRNFSWNSVPIPLGFLPWFVCGLFPRLHLKFLHSSPWIFSRALHGFLNCFLH